MRRTNEAPNRFQLSTKALPPHVISNSARMGLYARRDASRTRQYFELLIQRRTYMSIRIIRLRPFLASSRRSIVDKLLDRLLECGFHSTLLSCTGPQPS